jgi:spore coat protein U-like protein
MNIKYNLLTVPAFVVLAGVCLAPAAWATTSTNDMAVSANIEIACSVSASPMAFGTVLPGAVKDTTAVVTAICTTGTAYTLDLGDGLNHITTGGTGLQYRRQMASAANRLPYVVAIDDTYETEIGATSVAAATNNLLTTTNGNAVAQPITIYGRIVAAESLAKAPGAYADTVVVTIAF